MLHKKIQHTIAALFPAAEIAIEHPFPGHIADLVWLPRKIIFEVQCSALSIEIVMARKRDYEALGYHLVWILHQKSFNTKSLSLSEVYMREGAAYYTDMNAQGVGKIYDQWEDLSFNRRLFRSKPLPIDLTRPIMKGSRLYFFGDRRLISRPKEVRPPRSFEFLRQGHRLFMKRVLKLISN